MSKENTAVTKKKIKRCKEDVVFDAACFIILTLVLFVVAYPLYWVIISSISAPSAVSSGKVLLHPIGFTLKGYAEVFKNDQVMRGFLNSLIITFCGVMVNLIVTLPTSYALSRSNFSGKKPITIFYLITMFFGGGLIPTYLTVKELGLNGTLWAIIIPGSLSVYNMIILRTSFESIPESLVESTMLDGASHLQILTRIILPLSLPGVVSGITMVFVPSVSTFAISRMLGGGTELLLGDLIERQFLGGAYNPQLGAAISLVMMIIVLVCMLVMNRFGEGEEQAVKL